MTNETPRPISKLGFLTIGFFDEHDPFAGHESTLQIIELGERLGFDSAWLRDRHLQHGISSPVAVLAAASQRTSRIELGTAVIPLGLENPFRLAEDLATVDVLSRGRLNPGVSVGVPTHFDDIKEHLYPDSWATENFTTERVERLLHNLRGGDVSTFSGTQGIETFSTRIQPHSPGLADRLWYGAAGLSSAAWAGEHGLNLLSSSVVRAEEDDDFARIQRAQIDLFREKHPLGEAARASQGLVVIPTDTASAEQKAKYRAYAEGRFGRTTKPQGPQRMLFAPDLVGDSEQIAEALRAHAGFRAVDELVFALPFTLDHEDYVQILTDMATVLGPLLGWKPGNLDTVARKN
jgi:alkanesulfonate monooxygenase SsuD/methylene tetrahydromethanopterin reductase-like flavin-dependent oxidoreductase (luciferase family)